MERVNPVSSQVFSFNVSSNTLPWCSSHVHHHIQSSGACLGNPRSSESQDPWTRSLHSPWFPPSQTLSVCPGSSSVPLQQEVRGGGQNESLLYWLHLCQKQRIVNSGFQLQHAIFIASVESDLLLSYMFVMKPPQKIQYVRQHIWVLF